MAFTPARIVLFLIGLFAAGGLVAYGSGAFEPRQAEPKVAALKSSTPGATMTTQPASANAQPQAEPAIPSSITGEPQANSAQLQQDAALDTKAAPDGVQSTRSDRVTPSFDILRVEPDGSTVVAGRAKPGATVEMMSGTAALGQTTVSPNGDFAIALDHPLPAGDHTLVLRANSDAGSATSTEMAIVSVPRDKNGQVLAMVQEPGQPSRLISLPQAEGEEQKAGNTATQPATPAIPTQEQQAANATAETKASNAAGTSLQAPASGPATEASPSVAAANPAQPTQAAQDVPTVEAVEIEGSMIYVAGRAAPGAKLRAYANDDFLGEATASPDGQFLVEARRDLAVGKYTIRIDAIGADGATVTQRAAVPFEREAGETLAAVAPAQARPAAIETPAATATAAQPPLGTGAAGEPATAPASGQAPATSSAATIAAATPNQATAQTLQPVKGAVIIRRGDSLWRISKRAYGRGVRYSTIYLANQDQIQNPNRIWPGQVFQMPDSTTHGEKADMTRLGDQATTRD